MSYMTQKQKEDSKIQHEKEKEQKKKDQRLQLRMTANPTTVAGVKKQREKFDEASSDIEKVDVVIGGMLQQLLSDSKPGKLILVDWKDSTQRQIRKSQMANIKDEISIIRQLMELMLVLEDKSSKEGDKQLRGEANVTLLKDARKQLKKVGVKDL